LLRYPVAKNTGNGLTDRRGRKKHLVQNQAAITKQPECVGRKKREKRDFFFCLGRNRSSRSKKNSEIFTHHMSALTLQFRIHALEHKQPQT
jgi:hypothetical protein